MLSFFHELACGGHLGPRKTIEKVLQSGFYWPIPFLFIMCKLPKNWEDFEARHDALKPDSRSQNF